VALTNQANPIHGVPCIPVLRPDWLIDDVIGDVTEWPPGHTSVH